MDLDCLEAGTCDNPSPCLACALAEALAPIRTHVSGKGPGLLQGHDCASASRVLLSTGGCQEEDKLTLSPNCLKCHIPSADVAFPA